MVSCSAVGDLATDWLALRAFTYKIQPFDTMVLDRLEHQLHVEISVQHGGVSSEDLCMGEDKSEAVT
jgi:hypothetical protein